MPAWGTVTTSPACNRILFLVFPASISWYKLTVMVFVGVEAEGAFALSLEFCDGEFAGGNWGGSAAGVFVDETDEAGAETCGLASDLKVWASAAAAGAGSESSKAISGTGRVMMTASPASLERPPASARTSRS